MQRLIDSGIHKIFKSPNEDDSKNRYLMQLRSCLIENRSLIDQVCFRFVFTGVPNEAERSMVLDKLREDLENKRFLVEQFFQPRPVRFVVEFRSSTGKIGGLRSSEKSAKFPILIDKQISAEAKGGEKLLTVFMPLTHLYKMYKSLGTHFFDRNVRYGLGTSKSVNRAISKALREIVIDETQDPATFTFNHNGVTLYAESVDEEPGELKLSSPRLLNGAQTVTSFADFMKEYGDHPKLAVNADSLKEIRVLCKIISNASDAFVTHATINTNRQNPVEPWNLHANDMIQLELQDKFRDDLQLYYERQENAFSQLSAEDLDEYGFRIIQKLFKCSSWHKILSLRTGTSAAYPKCVTFSRTIGLMSGVFDSDRLRANSRHILLCYKIERRLRQITGDIVQKGANKYWFAPKARYLIWALACQGILNSKNLEAISDEDGKRLVVSANYTDNISKIATANVAPILAELVVEKEYAERLAEEKLGFLRTDAAFEKSMKLAYKKWKWVHKKLV